MHAIAALLTLLSGPPADAAAPESGRGLWIGPIHVCRETGARVAVAADLAGGPTVTILLGPDGQAQLARETARLAGTALSVRLDGRVLLEPIVREAITGGMLQLSGLSAKDAAAIEAAALRACLP